MDQKRVRFYFTFNSPYAFLASTRIERHVAPLGVELEYKPVYSARTGAPPDLSSPRFSYIFEDAGRFARSYGLELRPGPFVDTGKACRGFFFAREQGTERAYCAAVYAARWLRNEDISRDETLGAIAERAALDRGVFLAALGDARHEAALQRSNDDATADGVFGFPFFVYAGQRFWGNDRIEWLVEAIRKG